MLGVFLDLDTVGPADLDLSTLRESLPQWHFHGTSARAEIAARIADAEVVVSNKAPLDAALLAGAPALRLICVAATGTNNVDLAAARARGITVTNVRAYATPSVVQHVFALILTLTTRLPDYDAAVRAGRWASSPHFCLLDYPIRELHGKHLGIVGYGELGRAVAGVAQAFGMQVLLARRPGAAAQPQRLALEDLLPQVDVLTLHCPLTPETRGLIGAAALSRMGPQALLINTARGGIVDEAALADALREGRIGGAGIDVLAEEPPVHGSPLLDPALPNLIVTPHCAWASRESRQRLIEQVGATIRAFLRSTPQNVVN